MKSMIVKTDGVVIYTNPQNGTDFQLEELQEIVGGYIEIVEIANGNIIVLDEEGKLKDKAINMTATLLLRDTGVNDYIVGDVLICEGRLVQ